MENHRDIRGIAMIAKKGRAEINRVIFTPVEELQEEDWPIVEWIIEKGFMPLCDYAFLTPKRVTMQEQYDMLKEALEKRRMS